MKPSELFRLGTQEPALFVALGRFGGDLAHTLPTVPHAADAYFTALTSRLR